MNELAITRKKHQTYATHSCVQDNPKFQREIQRLTIARFLSRRSKLTRATVEATNRRCRGVPGKDRAYRSVIWHAPTEQMGHPVGGTIEQDYEGMPQLN